MNTTQIVITVMVGILMFTLGFFTNLIAMRRMFVSKDTYDKYVKEADKRVKDLEKDYMSEKEFKSLKEEINKKCDDRMSQCGRNYTRIESTLTKIEESMSQLSDYSRSNYGNIREIMAHLKLKSDT